MMTNIVLIGGALLLAGAGTWGVQEWRWGAKEAVRMEAERVAEEARQTDAKQQRQFIDTAAGKHAAAVAGLSRQLGDARAQIATLSTTRQCLDAGTVSMLNAIGKPALGLRASAADAESAAPAVARHTPNTGYASERDTAEWIATCRAQYGVVSDQLNKILDIEDRRQQGVQ